MINADHSSRNTPPKPIPGTTDWQLAPEEGGLPLSLTVQQRRKAWVFPWHRFVWADGDHTQVQIVFAPHSVTVTGHGLASLLMALATQRVVLISQATESESRFRETAAGIQDIAVKPLPQ